MNASDARRLHLFDPYARVLRHMLTLGQHHEGTLEVLDMTIGVSRPDAFARPRWSATLAAEMARQTITGDISMERLKELAPHMQMYLWDGHPFEGGVIHEALQRLRAEMHTRRAVLTLPPEYCWTALHILERNEMVHLFAYQRSCDLYLGLPYDAYLLYRIGEFIADTKPVSVILHIGSAHIYDRDIPTIKQLLGWPDENH